MRRPVQLQYKMEDITVQPGRNVLLRIFFLSALSAGLYGLASPDLHWHPLCWVLLIPLLEALDGMRSRRAFFTGWLCGGMIHLVLLSWVIGTVQRFTHLNLPLSILAWILLSLYSGLAFGVMASLFCFLSRARPAQGFIIFPLAYTAMEFLFPSLFPWHLGAGLYGLIPMIQISDIFGVYGLTALVVLVNFSLWEVFRFFRKKRPFPRFSLVVAMSLVLLSLLYGVWRIDSIQGYRARAKKLTVGVVQPNISNEERMSPPLHPDIWQRYERLSGEAVRENAEFLVWPESALYFPFDPGAEASSSSEMLVRLVRSLDTPLLFGTWSVRPNGPRNTAFLLNRRGNLAGRYDKVHLLPFGEYIPLSDRFPQISKWIHGAVNLRPGQKIGPLCLENVCFGVLICYEATLDGLSRKSAVKGAKFLVNITNDVWFGNTQCPEQHLMLASFRAVENRVWLVRAANTGISAFVDPAGRILDRIPLFQQGERVRMIELLDVPSIYKAWGDWFPISCTVILTLLLLRGFTVGLKGR